jgi:GTP cyclohydrolase I
MTESFGIKPTTGLIGRAGPLVTGSQAIIANHLVAILNELGLDPDNQHFLKTPDRFAKVLMAYVQPMDLQDALSAGFEDDDFAEGAGEGNERTLVVQTNIPFMGLCAHHLLPFFGSAAVGYLPRQRVVGLSKLTRLVYAAGHLAPTTQEHITNLVADTLWESDVKPKGVAVLTSALHGCMAVRGVEAPATRTIVSAIRGAFKDVPALEAKFMTLAEKGLHIDG